MGENAIAQNECVDFVLAEVFDSRMNARNDRKSRPLAVLEGDVLHFCDDVRNLGFITLAETGSLKAIHTPVEFA